MIYNDFKGKKLSSLGLGCMRLPLCSEKESDIDIPAAKEMFRYAIENGINYFDTAYGYHWGNSECVTGSLLSEYERDSFYLASKFPGFSDDLFERKEEVFKEQLSKCKVDYFDFYLLHCVSDSSIDNYVSSKYALREFLIQQKKEGKIRHLGFSSHCGFETFRRLLDYYGEHIEFAQLQLNWFDWSFQEAYKKVELLNELNIPIWVMEPLRGGSLVNLKPTFKKRLEAVNSDRKNAEWAFRYLQSVKGVTVTLSGMSSLEQLRENIATYSKFEPLSGQETEILFKIGSDMANKDALPCTACGYCLSECPKGLNIPLFTEAYNDYVYEGESYRLPDKIKALKTDKLSSNCIGCGKCEKVCPQNIKISEMMRTFTDKIL